MIIKSLSFLDGLEHDDQMGKSNRKHGAGALYHMIQIQQLYLVELYSFIQIDIIFTLIEKYLWADGGFLSPD